MYIADDVGPENALSTESYEDWICGTISPMAGPADGACCF